LAFISVSFVRMETDLYRSVEGICSNLADCAGQLLDM
jgi:hypothetical protein